MIVIVLLILVFIILCVNPLSILSGFEPVYRWLHQSCLQKIQVHENVLNPIYSALVCGENIPEGSIRNLFTSVGIIHLLVISGTHLIFIEKMWKLLPEFRFRDSLLAGFLLLYALTAGLRPPILRALFSLILTRVIKKCKLFWSPYLRVQMSGLLCLLCQSSWVHSLSLQLSWTASFGMCNRKLSRLTSCCLTYLLILPIISRWGGSHPMSVLVNWLIAPLASCVLLPLSILVIPFPFIRFLTDSLWELLFYILDKLRPLVENNTIWMASFDTFQTWMYISGLFIGFKIYGIYANRRECD